MVEFMAEDWGRIGVLVALERFLPVISTAVVKVRLDGPPALEILLRGRAHIQAILRTTVAFQISRWV